METNDPLVFTSEKDYRNYLRNLNLMPEAFNRIVNQGHADKMGASLKQIKVQRAINVVRTSAFGKKDALYVADGQHLRTGILKNPKLRLGRNLVVFENDIKEIEEIIPFVSQMNSVARNWSLKNYLDAWTTQGVKEYVFLTEKFEKLPYTLSCILETYVIDRGNVAAYRNGKVKINEFRGDQILKAYEGACKVGLNQNTSSLLATARFLKRGGQINVENFINMASKNSNTLKHKLNRDAYISLFQGYMKK